MINDFSKVDFVPEEEPWDGFSDEMDWDGPGEADLDETVVLEPLDSYEPGEERQVYSAGKHVAEEWPDAKRGAAESRRSTGRSAAGEWSDERKKVSRYGRDPYDVPKESRTAYQTVYEEEVTKKTRKKKKGRAVSAVKTVGRATGKVGKMSGRAAGRLLPFVLRLLSFALLGILVLRLGAGFWGQREALGSISQVVSERNYALALYLVLAVITLAYGLLSMLWILTRRRMAYEGRMHKYDTGRGLTAFLLFALLAFAAARTALYLPEAPHILAGLGEYLLVTASCQGILYLCSAAGVVCCVIRKIVKY